MADAAASMLLLGMDMIGCIEIHFAGNGSTEGAMSGRHTPT